MLLWHKKEKYLQGGKWCPAAEKGAEIFPGRRKLLMENEAVLGRKTSRNSCFLLDAGRRQRLGGRLPAENFCRAEVRINNEEQ